MVGSQRRILGMQTLHCDGIVSRVVSITATLILMAVSMAQRPTVGSLRVGDPAPLFKLQSIRGSAAFELKENIGKRPTVLIFGSYT
jgi:hypothetical protein